MIFVTMTQFIIHMITIAGIVSRRLCGSEDAPLSLHAAITAAIVGSSALVAMRYANLNDILGVLGGFGSVSFMFVIPASVPLDNIIIYYIYMYVYIYII